METQPQSNPPVAEDQVSLADLLSFLTEHEFTYARVVPETNDPGAKRRGDESWQTVRISADEVLSRVADGGNYAIVPPVGYFVVDFDNKTEDVYQRSIEREPIIADSLTFKTPNGYHVIFAGDGIAQGTSHTLLGKDVDTRVGGKGFIVGPGSKRPDGVYKYLSGDEILDAPDSLRKLLQKPASVPTSEIFPNGVPKAKSSPQARVEASPAESADRRPLTVMEAGAASKKHWKALKDAQEGERNDTLTRAACGLGSLYANADDAKRTEIFDRLMMEAERLGDGVQSEILQNRTTATNQWNKGMESPASRPAEPEQPETEYRIEFTKFNSQEFERAFENLNISVRENKGRRNIELMIKDDGSWPIPQTFRFKTGDWFVPDNRTIESLIYYINQYFGMKRGENVYGVVITKERFWQWLSGMASRNGINPFHSWIESCGPNPKYPDLSLENWLNPWLLNPDSEMKRWVQRAIFVAIVQNVYDDPQPCRVIPVLRGEKGIGKTTLVGHLIPESFSYHFGQFHVKRKAEMVGSLIGKYLCEFGELDGMGDSHVSTFKEFIGNLVNTARLPWERHFLDYRNQALIIGTSNPDRNVPNDDALRSRLVFVDLKKGPDPKVYLPDRLAHLYALAREAYNAGERVDVIPEQLEAEQREADEESVIINPIFDVKLRTIDWRLFGEWFTLYEVMRAAGLVSMYSNQAPSGAQKAVREYLRELGVGTKRNEMRKKGSGGLWHYRESDEVKRIRAELIKSKGLKSPIYGHGIEASTDLSSLG